MSKQNLLDRTGASAKLLCGLSLAFACVPAWSDSSDPKYTMTVFTETAHGTKVVAGKYEQAIDNITRKSGKVDDFYKGTNLCVAYAKAGELELAEEACDAAVAAASKAKMRRSGNALASTMHHARNVNLAVALSNRGVLYAVRGDTDRAREEFDAALAVNSQLTAAKVNLARLGSDTADPA